MKNATLPALVAALVMGCTSARADVKIGELYPFSGELALLGGESARGAELAVDRINAEGGVKGQKVSLVRGDAVDNNQAIGEARRLISLSGVKAIFGTYSSSRAIAASQVAELAGIPYLEFGAVADEVTGRGLHYLFRTNPTADDMAKMIVAMLVQKIAPGVGEKPGDLKIGLVHENSNYGTSVAGHEEAYGRAAGLRIISDDAYPDATVDLSSLVQKLKSEGADVVLQTSYQNDSVLFLQEAHEGGYEPKAIIGGGGGYSLLPTLKAVGPAVMNGVFDVDFTQYLVNTTYTPGLTDFVAAYEKRYGEPPRSGHSLNNYVGALAVLEAMNKAKSLSPDDIVAAVKSIDVPDGKTAAGYGLHFGANNQNDRAAMTGMQWQDGKLVTVFPQAAAVAPMHFPAAAK